MEQDNNCYISTNDPIVYKVYNKGGTIELFGEDYLREYGHALPDELIQAYFENMREFERIQKELEKYKNGK